MSVYKFNDKVSHELAKTVYDKNKLRNKRFKIKHNINNDEYKIVDYRIDDINGFQAMAVSPIINNKVDNDTLIFVYAGTDPKKITADWVADAQMPFIKAEAKYKDPNVKEISENNQYKNKNKSQVEEADAWTKRVLEENKVKRVYGSGHSLGSFLNQAMAVNHNFDKAISFSGTNAYPSLSEQALSKYKKGKLKNRIINYIHTRDPISNLSFDLPFLANTKIAKTKKDLQFDINPLVEHSLDSYEFDKNGNVMVDKGNTAIFSYMEKYRKHPIVNAFIDINIFGILNHLNWYKNTFSNVLKYNQFLANKKYLMTNHMKNILNQNFGYFLMFGISSLFHRKFSPFMTKPDNTLSFLLFYRLLGMRNKVDIVNGTLASNIDKMILNTLNEKTAYHSGKKFKIDPMEVRVLANSLDSELYLIRETERLLESYVEATESQSKQILNKYQNEMSFEMLHYVSIDDLRCEMEAMSQGGTYNFYSQFLFYEIHANLRNVQRLYETYINELNGATDEFEDTDLILSENFGLQ